jgi:hypothetical protein
VPLPAAKRADDDVMHVLVTWKRQPESHLGDVVEVAAENAFDNDVASNETSLSEEEKRGSKDVEVEIGNYLDKFWVEAVANKLNRNSNQQLTDLQILKWSAAARILKSPSLNWDVTLKLADVNIMRDDNSIYKAKKNESMMQRMQQICAGTRGEDFDQVTLHTQDISNTRMWGLAWIGNVCDSRYRCAVSNRVHTTLSKPNSIKFRQLTEFHRIFHGISWNSANLSFIIPWNSMENSVEFH